MWISAMAATGLWQIFIGFYVWKNIVIHPSWRWLASASILMGMRRCSAAYTIYERDPDTAPEVLDKILLPLMITALMGEFARRHPHRELVDDLQ